MKRYIILLSVFILSAAFLANPALAAKGVIKNSGSGDMLGNITTTDLGIENPGTLPTSGFYFLKEWGREISRFFTFNSVAKTELELKIANEKAAEALKVQETKPDNTKALSTALENYTKAGERLQARFIKIRDTDNSPDDFEKLLLKLNEQTLKHAILFNQLAERWSAYPYTEDANIVNPRGTRDNHLQGAVDVVQKKIQEIVIIAAEREKDIKQKAEEQIKGAESLIKELESELAKLKSGFIYSSQTQSAEFAINEPGAPNNRAINTKRTGAVARTTDEPNAPSEKTGPIWIDPTPARISTNMTIERMKAGLDTAGGILANAKAHLVLAQAAFADGKFGEAFGQARSAEVLARNGLRAIESEKSKNQKNSAKEGCIGNENESCPHTWQSRRCMNGLWVCDPASLSAPDIDTEGKQRVFPETNNRVFPETNNRTVCDDRQAPGCLRGEILECKNGRWVCIGPASGLKEGQIIPIAPTPTPSPTVVTPTIYEFKLEADDSGFYPEPTITIPRGSGVKIYFTVRTSNVYYGGLDFRSSKFRTEPVKPGETAYVKFIADESFIFTSYWPLSEVQKASGNVIVK